MNNTISHEYIRFSYTDCSFIRGLQKLINADNNIKDFLLQSEKIKKFYDTSNIFYTHNDIEICKTFLEEVEELIRTKKNIGSYHTEGDITYYLLRSYGKFSFRIDFKEEYNNSFFVFHLFLYNEEGKQNIQYIIDNITLNKWLITEDNINFKEALIEMYKGLVITERNGR